MTPFNGLGMNLGNLSRLSSAQTRSISAENFTGEKGKGAMATDGTGVACARDLGVGWKVSPSVRIGPGETFTLADIEGAGAIQSIWITGHVSRDFILRVHWDDQEQPSIEVPLPDFFALPWGPTYQETINGQSELASVRVNSQPVMVAPKSGMNCFWEMPFRKRCRMTLENLDPDEAKVCYYQINYTLTDVPEDCAYFHAQYRRVNPLPYKEVYTIVEGIEGRGQYVGTSMGWGINNNRWWGEGEIKFYMDGDDEYPTICGTGTEDYFGGSYNWDVGGEYQIYTTPFLGMHQVIRPDGTYNAQHRHAMYRWHVMDPIRFEQDLRVTIQALGWRSGRRYYPGQHDITSVAYWYQTLPTAPFPAFPTRDELEIV
ncbi:MAG: glycoside hydrolase family 172 protein [Chloroflexota bacterium]